MVFTGRTAAARRPPLDASPEPATVFRMNWHRSTPRSARTLSGAPTRCEVYLQRALRMTLVLGLAALTCGTALAADAEFSADVSIAVGTNMTATGRVFVKGAKRRNEITMFQRPAISILRPDKNLTLVLLPNKQYRQFPLRSDPLHPGSDTPYDTKEVGTEKVNGYECKKLLLTFKDPEKGSLVQWFAPALNAPIRFELKNKDGKVVNTTDYTNIKPGPQPDALFEVPAGYTLQGIGMPSSSSVRPPVAHIARRRL